VPPPDLDLPPRPVPRAPLTDVVPKRTLVIVAVVVVLAVIGTVLALTLGGGDDNGAEGGGKGSGSHASASADAKASAKGDTGKAGSGGTANGEQADSATGTAGSGDANGSPAASSGTGTSDDDSDSGSDSGSGSDDYGSAPPVSTYKGSQKFTIGLPKGWKYTSSDTAGARFTGPEGQRLLVAWTSQPAGDPVADWQRQEGDMVRPGYRKIRIEKVGYRGWNAADWEFSYTDGGTRYRVIDRGFVVDAHRAYALMYTAKAGNWGTDLRKDTWRTLTKTFEPK
jgi:hypothetical protein